VYFLPGDRYLAPISVKICTMVELRPIRGLCTFGADNFRGLQIGGHFFTARRMAKHGLGRRRNMSIRPASVCHSLVMHQKTETYR